MDAKQIVRIAKTVRAVVFVLDAPHKDDFVTSCMVDAVEGKKNGRAKWLRDQIQTGGKWGQGLAMILADEQRCYEIAKEQKAAKAA